MSSIKVKKSLGQNFLNSEPILEKIISAGDIGPDDIALEAGPGYGHLTTKLLEKACKVIAVEKDDRLVSWLQEKFAVEINSGKLELIHGDILNFNPYDYKLKAKSYKLVANIPYYITGKFLRKFLEISEKPSLMVLMLQKEVVERIVAKNTKPLDSLDKAQGKESILSISVKVFGKPKLIAKVKKGSFSPQPKVDSAILLITDISDAFFKKIDQKKFFLLVKAGFKQKRKRLINNLKDFGNKEKLEKSFQICQISLNSRPENLTPDNWQCLAKSLGNQR